MFTALTLVSFIQFVTRVKQTKPLRAYPWKDIVLSGIFKLIILICVLSVPYWSARALRKLRMTLLRCEERAGTISLQDSWPIYRKSSNVDMTKGLDSLLLNIYKLRLRYDRISGYFGTGYYKPKHWTQRRQVYNRMVGKYMELVECL